MGPACVSVGGLPPPPSAAPPRAPARLCAGLPRATGRPFLEWGDSPRRLRRRPPALLPAWLGGEVVCRGAATSHQARSLDPAWACAGSGRLAPILRIRA